jgi:hypothetical protein
VIEKIALKKSLNQVLVESRFERKSNSWYGSGNDAIVVLNLQKSDFGNYFYINIGVCLKSLTSEIFPKISKCHISMRADHLVGDNAPQLALGLNLDDGDEKALEDATDIVRNQVVPVLLGFMNIDTLRDFYFKGGLKRSLIHWQARDLLESSAV